MSFVCVLLSMDLFVRMLVILFCTLLITCKFINLVVVIMHPHVHFIVRFYHTRACKPLYHGLRLYANSIS